MPGMITQGTDFRISDDGVTYTSLGCVESWALEQPERAEIDTTCLMSTSKDFMFGLKDSGTLSVELIYSVDGAGQVILQDSYASPDAYFFEVEYSDNAGSTGTVKSFKGFVTSMSQSGGKDDVVRQSVTIKITGDVTTVAPTP